MSFNFQKAENYLPSFKNKPPDSNQILCNFCKSLFTFVFDESGK